MEPKIIFQDESLLIIDKPSGWITNDAETTKDQPTVQNWLRRNFQFPIFNFQEYRNGIVHRLDKETSGILLVAKTKEAFGILQAEFKSREVEKTYIALLHGRVERDGEINVPVGRLPWRRDRFGVIAGGRESVTKYKVLSVFSSRLSENGLPVCQSTRQTEKLINQNLKTENREQRSEYFSLVEFYPKTGRTHQIRIHAKHIGHAVVGDEFYAGRKTARNDRKWCPRLFLHAASIKFIHPETGKEIEFKSELPQDLSTVIAKLEK